nr:MAG: coat protein [Hangzhou fiers-like virus 1]
MPQLIAVSIPDGTNDHTFAPRGIDTNGVATLVESTGVPIADRRLTVQRSRTSQGREKVTFKFTIPVIVNATVNGVTQSQITRSAYADVVFSFDGTSTTAERAALRNMVVNLLASSAGPADDLIDNLESLY